MDSGADRMFCLLAAAEDPVSVSRLNSKMYMYQVAGFKLGYKFLVNSSGLYSRALMQFVERNVAVGFVEMSRGYVLLTPDSDMAFKECIMSWDELDLLDSVNSVLTSLSDDDLYLACISDLVITDVSKVRGIGGLASARGFIEDSVRSLCRGYSEKKFLEAVSVLRAVRGLKSA